MIRRVAGMCVVALLLSPPAWSAGNIFDALAGEWQGSGEVRGMASEQSMVWSQVLDGQFTRLEFDNRMSQDGELVFHFRAHAYYRVDGDGRVTGHWFDSRGVSFPLQGTRTGSSLNIEWGTSETELGRTAYRIDGDRLEVTDEVLGAGGEWRVFGRSTLRMSAESPN